MEAGGERMMLVSRMLPWAHSEEEVATLGSVVPVVPGIIIAAEEGEGCSMSKDMLRRS